MSGLEPVVFLAKGARVMLTTNLWPSVGLCNGATGTIVDIIFENNHQPPDLLIAVIVKFENYRGPVFDQEKPMCIPICPITVSSQTEFGFHDRQQLIASQTCLGSYNTQEPRTYTSKSMDRYWQI